VLCFLKVISVKNVPIGVLFCLRSLWGVMYACKIVICGSCYARVYILFVYVTSYTKQIKNDTDMKMILEIYFLKCIYNTRIPGGTEVFLRNKDKLF